MLLEEVCDQNIKELEKTVITYIAERINSAKQTYEFSIDDLNKVFKLMLWMDMFVYHGYSFDSVLYTAYWIPYDHHHSVKITGDGVSLNQAICNLFINVCDSNINL